MIRNKRVQGSREKPIDLEQVEEMMPLTRVGGLCATTNANNLPMDPARRMQFFPRSPSPLLGDPKALVIRPVQYSTAACAITTCTPNTRTARLPQGLSLASSRRHLDMS